MSTFYSNNLRVLVAKKEDPINPGIPVPFNNGDFNVRIIDPIVTPTIEADDEAGKYATGDHGEDVSIMGAQSATIDFSVKVSRVGNTITEPSWWKFAEACGCEITPYENTGLALQPKKSKDISTLTIRVYDIPRGASGTPAACYTFAGCMGNMIIGAEGVGKPWIAQFSFTGKLVRVAEAEGAIPELSINNADSTVEKLLNYDLSFGVGNNKSSQKISSFSLDVGNEISPLIDQSDETGYAYYAITKRSPRLSCNPLIDGSFENIYNNWKGQATFPVKLKPAASDGGNAGGYTLFLPRAQLLTAAIASREGLVNWDLNLKALRNNESVIEDPEVTWELRIGQKQ